MSQPIKSSFNENFNNQVPNVPYFSQQINNNVAELLEKENINKKDDNFIYELVFNIVSNISNSDKPSEIKIKIIRILTKLIENILKAETLGKDSEKYRRVKITNPNIHNRKKGLAEYNDLTMAFNTNFNEDYSKLFKDNSNRFKKFTGIFTNMYDSSIKNGGMGMPFNQKPKSGKDI